MTDKVRGPFPLVPALESQIGDASGQQVVYRFSSATWIPRREKLETGKYARRFKTGSITAVHQLVSTGK